MKKPENPKERNMVNSALRRAFSRSELRKAALAATAIEHHDVRRPRVTKWAWCTACGLIEAQYLFEVDHVDPVVPIGTPLAEMEWDEVVDRLWCDPANLRPLCKPCHRQKSNIESDARKAIRKGKKNK